MNEETERGFFECWAKTQGYDIGRMPAPYTSSTDKRGEYYDQTTNDSWLAWQGRASMPAIDAPIPPTSKEQLTELRLALGLLGDVIGTGITDATIVELVSEAREKLENVVHQLMTSGETREAHHEVTAACVENDCHCQRPRCDRAEILVQRAINCGWIQCLGEHGGHQLQKTARIALDAEVEAGGPYPTPASPTLVWQCCDVWYGPAREACPICKKPRAAVKTSGDSHG